jgi:hypothetical protein
LIDAWVSEQMRQGRRVRLALGNNGGKLLLPNYRLEPTASISLSMRELERLQAQKPFNIQVNTLDYTLYDLAPAGLSVVPGPPFRHQTGPGDEQATVVGWYGRETDSAGTPYRWTNGDAMLRIPWPADRGDLRLKLHLSGGLRPASLGQAQVDLYLATTQNDRTAPKIASLTSGPTFETYEVIVPRASLPDQPTGAAILWLRNSAWQPSAHGVPTDGRWLGVRLAWLEMTAAH